MLGGFGRQLLGFRDLGFQGLGLRRLGPLAAAQHLPAFIQQFPPPSKKLITPRDQKKSLDHKPRLYEGRGLKERTNLSKAPSNPADVRTQTMISAPVSSLVKFEQDSAFLVL